MERKERDPFRLSVELEGIAAIAACLSALYLNDSGDRPTDEVLGNTFVALEEYLERIAEDVSELDKHYCPKEA